MEVSIVEAMSGDDTFVTGRGKEGSAGFHGVDGTVDVDFAEGGGEQERALWGSLDEIWWVANEGNYDRSQHSSRRRYPRARTVLKGRKAKET
jgi:hypothetical protein